MNPFHVISFQSRTTSYYYCIKIVEITITIAYILLHFCKGHTSDFRSLLNSKIIFQVEIAKRRINNMQILSIFSTKTSLILFSIKPSQTHANFILASYTYCKIISEFVEKFNQYMTKH